MSIILIISIGSKFNNILFFIARYFFVWLSPRNVALLRFGKLAACSGALALVVTQLLHAKIGVYPQPDIFVENVMYPGYIFMGAMTNVFLSKLRASM